MKTRLLPLLLSLLSLLLAPGILRAQATADQGLIQFVADKAKEGRPVVLFAPYHKPIYAAYLPVWTFHADYDKDAAGKDIKDAYRQFFSVGGGGKYDMETRRADGFVSMDFNLVALSARAWDFGWAKSHVDRSKFPPIYLGPAWIAPLSWEALRTVSIGRDLRGQAGIAYPFTAFQTASPNTP